MTNLIIFFLFGLVLAYIFKSYRSYEENFQKAHENIELTKYALRRSELGLFMALTAKVAKADGRVDSLEAELIRVLLDDISAIFSDTSKAREIFKEIFNEEKKRSDNIEHIASALKRAIRGDRAKEELFIGFLIQLAFADGELSKSEEQVLGRIAEAMEIDSNLYYALFDRFENLHANRTQSSVDSLKEAYKTLGVSPEDNLEYIKKAYRKLIRKYHPDLIKAQGKDETYLQEATKKTQAINAAYELIKQYRS